MATVWDVKRSPQGVIDNLQTKRPFINHYSFHIMDADSDTSPSRWRAIPPLARILQRHEDVPAKHGGEE